MLFLETAEQSTGKKRNKSTLYNVTTYTSAALFEIKAIFKVMTVLQHESIERCKNELFKLRSY